MTLPKNEYQLAHDRASFLSGQKVQKLMEQGGRNRREMTGDSKECRERARERERERRKEKGERRKERGEREREGEGEGESEQFSRNQQGQEG